MPWTLVTVCDILRGKLYSPFQTGDLAKESFKQGRFAASDGANQNGEFFSRNYNIYWFQNRFSEIPSEVTVMHSDCVIIEFSQITFYRATHLGLLCRDTYFFRAKWRYRMLRNVDWGFRRFRWQLTLIDIVFFAQESLYPGKRTKRSHEWYQWHY